MKKLSVTVILLFAFSWTALAQLNYSGKVEMGYLRFKRTTLDVDPGPNWKGYHLNDGQNGFDLNVVNGISLAKEKVFIGIGVGYLNFEGINGFSVFSDFEYLPFKTRLTPLLNLKIGYDHIWNQYDGGRATTLVDVGVGINYKLNDHLSMFLKSGFMLTQQSSLVPVRIGIRF